MSAIAGRVLMLPKGNYDATTTYEFLDAVYYSGSTYICKQQTTGHAPTDTTYWQLMAQGTQSAQIAGNYYGTCDTASATANKVVTVPASENFVLQIGDIVGVRFTNTNTANNPTLNVNNSGAKPIYYNDDAVHTNYLWASGEADRDTLFMYDGTNWVWIAHDVDLDTDALADLTDTAISSPTNGQVLKYNATSHKWENKTLVAGDVGFDNTGTDLVSNNVNDAIVEVNTKVNDIDERLDNKIVTVEKSNVATNGAGQIAISSLSLPTGAKLLNFSFSQGYLGWIRTDGYIQVVGFNSSTVAISSAANKTITTMNITYSV